MDVLRYHARDILVSFEESFNATAPVVCACLNVFTLCQGWDAYGYSCYLMEETPRTWSEAKAFCKAQDGFMLHIGDMYVRSFKQQRCVRTTCAAGFSWLLSIYILSDVSLQRSEL